MKRAKRLDNGMWIVGYLVVRNCDGYKRTYIYDSFYDEMEIDEYADDDGKKSLKELFIPVDPETVEQYTKEA